MASKTTSGSREACDLSLCMIVRDNGKTLPAALESIRPWVDEMIVVDTGSTDSTPEIAKEHGAQVFHFPWCDDFAAARNESLRHARGSWIFWMDSDDTIDEINGQKLREIAWSRHDPSVMAYVMQVHCPGAADRADATVVDHVKLFRNIPGIRFEGRIHEQVLPSIRRAGGEVAWTDVFVTHSGSDQSPEGLRRKQQRDLRLLQLELADRPNHPFTLFNLGMTYADMEEHEKAIEHLRRSREAAADTESHLRKVYALLTSSYSQLGQHHQAWDTCLGGLALFADDPELLFRKGVLAHRLGRLQLAEQAFLRVLQTPKERHFSSIDRGITGFKARQNLAVLYADQKRLAEAEDQWRHVVEEVPSYRQGWRGLCDSLIQQGKLDAAEAECKRMSGSADLHCESLLITAEIAGARGELESSGNHLRKAVNTYSDDLEALQAACRWFFDHGDATEAEEALRRLIRLRPLDGSAHHNLGTVYARQERWMEAIEAYRESLRVRPDAVVTQRMLQNAIAYQEKTLEAVT